MICVHCGRESDPLFKFCLHCGKELSAPKEDKPAAAPAPPPEEVAEPVAEPSFEEEVSAAEEPLEEPAVSEPDLAEEPEPEPAEEAQAEPAEEAQAEPAEEASQEAEAEPAKAARCSRCRAKLEPNANVCHLCGHHVGDEVVPGRDEAERGRDTAKISLKRKPAGYLISVSSVDGRETVKVPIFVGKNTLGRENCDLQFPEDDLLSPTHLLLEVGVENVNLSCPGSRNGTYVRMSDQVKLDHGDLFRLGQQLLKFEELEKLAAVIASSEDGVQVLGSPAGPKAWGRLTQVITDDENGSSFLLTSENVFLGRERGNITFPGDRYISGTHAVIARRADGTYLRDVGSSNGTYIRVPGDMVIESGQYFLAGRQLFKLYIERQ